MALADDLATLTAQVKATTDVEASAALAIKGIADALAALKASSDTTATDAAIQGFASQLKASSDALAAAVAANTVAAPAAPPAS